VISLSFVSRFAFHVWRLGYRFSGLWFRVSDLRQVGIDFRRELRDLFLLHFVFWVLGLGFRVSGFKFRVPGLGFRVACLVFGVSVSGFQGQGLGFRPRYACPTAQRRLDHDRGLRVPSRV